MNTLRLVDRAEGLQVTFFKVFTLKITLTITSYIKKTDSFYIIIFDRKLFEYTVTFARMPHSCCVFN